MDQSDLHTFFMLAALFCVSLGISAAWRAVSPRTAPPEAAVFVLLVLGLGVGVPLGLALWVWLF